MILLCNGFLRSILLSSNLVYATTISQVPLRLTDGLNRLVGQGQSCELSNSPVKGHSFPSLLDVTLDDLTAGLESGLFTSVDLVNVGRRASDLII